MLGAECWELILHGSHISAHCMSRGTDRLVLDIFLFLDIIQQKTLEERDNVSLRAKDVIKKLGFFKLRDLFKSGYDCFPSIIKWIAFQSPDMIQ